MGETLYGRTLPGTEKEIKPTQLIILYLTPVGKYPMILHDRSFFICFYPFFIKPHLKSEADLYIP